MNTSLEQLKEEARETAKDKFNFETIFGVNSRAEEETLKLMDLFIEKAFSLGKKDAVEGIKAVKRYSMELSDSYAGGANMEEDPELGEWVRREDLLQDAEGENT